jgi:hypothetical protein
MDNILIQKTHYEIVKELIQSKKLFNSFNFQTFISRLEPDCGKNPTYEEFAKSSFMLDLNSTLEGNLSQLAVFANVLYHLYTLYQQHERIYYICPKLAVDLAQTELNIDTHFLKAPFPEIYIQIDPGLYFISDETGEYPVRGFYVNTKEDGDKKILRIMTASLKTPYSQLSVTNDDILFYFRINLGPGKVNEQLQKYIEESVLSKKEELKTFNGLQNVTHLKELFFFIFNVLLYITSKDPDILAQLPINYKKKISGLKSQSKINKFLQRQSKTCKLPVLILGSKVVSNYPIDKIKNTGGIGKWKLNERVYVSGHWRIQWYGPADARRSDLIFIKPYEKGPEVSEIIGQRQYQVGKN